MYVCIYMRVCTNISILEFRGLSEIFFYFGPSCQILYVHTMKGSKPKIMYVTGHITGIGQNSGLITLICVFNCSRQSGFEQYCF